MYKIAIITTVKDPFVNLTLTFEENLYEVRYFNTDECGQNHARLSGFDFICLNLEYNDLTNIHLISSIKKDSKVPLYIFGKGHLEIEKAALLHAGAVGYIEIPFSVIEVYARINSVISYLNQLTKKNMIRLTYGPIEIDLSNHQIKNQLKIHNLTKVEYKILTILLSSKDETVTKDRIINFVWDNDKSATDNALGIHITRLRRKLDYENNVQLIETIWGVGYRLNYKLCDQSSE